MKIIIIGSNGQLGSDLKKVFAQENLIALTHQDIEIKNKEAMQELFVQFKADIVINTAAYHHVELCEKNPQESLKVNTLACLYLAQLSKDLHFTLVHYSTDYVFDGRANKGYTEESQTNPLNTYGLSKLWGEQLIQKYAEKYFIIRVSGIYGRQPCRAKGDNFITKMIRYAKKKSEVKVVQDEVLSPTSTLDIAKNTKVLLDSSKYGLYHMTSEGECSWYDFARVIFDRLNIRTKLTACSSSEFPSLVQRPKYSVLDNQALRHTGMNQMPSWKKALVEYLNQMSQVSQMSQIYQ